MAKEPDLKSGEAERCLGSSPSPSAIDMSVLITLFIPPLIRRVFCIPTFNQFLLMPTITTTVLNIYSIIFFDNQAHNCSKHYMWKELQEIW